MKNNLYDTIAAVSTPHGEGGISVIRVSGMKAFEIVSGIFSKSKTDFKPFNFEDAESHTIHFGYIFENGKIADEVLASVFKNPNSYTGEDVIELSSHGGTFVTQKILINVLSAGARHAEPGEYTKRAFLNRRIDLSQAEAVADLIKAKTEEAHRSSVNQLEGSLSDYVSKVRDELITTTALVELELDFADEDVEFAKKEEIKTQTDHIISSLKEIIASYISGKVIREGINVVIAGKPNSGKSSLFNSLLKSERAIVSEISGTTRDYIEENLIIGGVLFNLTDTAGLRTTEDIIETEGIKRSYGKIESADLVLFLIDSSQDEHSVKKDFDYYINNFNSPKTILVFSKTDISGQKKFSFAEDSIYTSINDAASILNLKNEMVRIATLGTIPVSSGAIILTNLRHKICLEKTVKALLNVQESIDNKMSGEFLSVDLRNAMNALGEITGEITNDDILNHIFAKFCIGK
jgi:tRNA modification GTPase